MNKIHQVTIKLTTEEYGWLSRYCGKNDVSMASVIRKALKVYRAALTAAKTKQKEE